MYNDFLKPRKNGDRQFFLPFLLGGLAGAGIVGVSRPRPVYVNSPTPYRPNYQPYPYQPYPYIPNGYYNYSAGGYY